MKKRIIAIVMSVCFCAITVISSSAAALDSANITSITSALSDFNPTNVVTVIVAGLGVAIPLILIWFAFRWIWGRAKSALKRGK